MNNYIYMIFQRIFNHVYINCNNYCNDFFISRIEISLNFVFVFCTSFAFLLNLINLFPFGTSNKTVHDCV